MAGLDDWLGLLRDRLEAALQAAIPRPSALWVALGRPDDGSDAAIHLTLAALHPAALARRPARPPGRGPGPAPMPPLTLDADLLVTARPPRAGYAEALTMLSHSLAWLHANPRLAPAGEPAFAAGTDPVELTPLDPTLAEATALIGAFGTGGMPFALYRVRGLAIGG
jgi:hypothetical protein